MTSSSPPEEMLYIDGTRRSGVGYAAAFVAGDTNGNEGQRVLMEKVNEPRFIRN